MTALSLTVAERGTVPLTAWRVWRVLPYRELDGRRTHRLCAIGTYGTPKVWEPLRASVAVCSGYASTHAAPWPRHQCGLWALPTLEQAEEALTKWMGFPGFVSGWAIGRVSLWGRIVEHERGWRAQYAYPYALTVKSPSAYVAEHIRRDYALDVDFEPVPAEVLFAAERKRRQNEHEVQQEAAKLKSEMAAVDKKLDRVDNELVRLQHALVVELEREKWQQSECVWLRRRLRDLRQELVQERRTMRFDDEQVLEAFRSVAPLEPVHARLVARELFPGEPSHSATIRVGQALRRLADVGQVTRVCRRDDGHEANRWQLPEVADHDARGA